MERARSVGPPASTNVAHTAAPGRRGGASAPAAPGGRSRLGSGRAGQRQFAARPPRRDRQRRR
eukprot:3381088-Lingulodinium_polyedra.AAC.1